MGRPHMRMAATVLGAPDPQALAAFYERLLGWNVVESHPVWVRLKPPDGGPGLSFQLEENYVAPVWPAASGEQQMMMHLDVGVEDLDEGVALARDAGATLADHQPQDHVRVMLDPAGHPFCLFQEAPFLPAYTETRDRLVELVRSLDDAQLATVVPACPAWTVKDLFAHVVHVAESYSTGRLPPVPSGPEDAAEAFSDEERDRLRNEWTQAGVDARKERSVDELVAEWDEHADVLGGMLTGERPWPDGVSGAVAAYSVNSDVASHAQDIRGALGMSADREARATKLAYDAFSFLLAGRAASAPGLRIVNERGELTIGSGDPRSTLEADWYELLRAISGRRSIDQIRELFGDIDAGPYLDVISTFPPPGRALSE